MFAAERVALPAALLLFLMVVVLEGSVGAHSASGKPVHCHGRLQEFFSGALDYNSDGFLSLREIHLMRTATAHGDQTPALEASDATSFLRNADTHPADGLISFWEFCNALDDGAPSYAGNSLDGQVHLSLTGAAREMRVTFVTKEPLALPCVTMSIAGAETNFTTVPATTTHYTVPKRAWEPTGNGGYIHSAVLSGLPPAMAVTYQPHGTDHLGQAVNFGKHSFTTAPAGMIPTKIALLADQGTFMGFGANITRQMISDFGPYGHDTWPSLIHHGGDISYAGIDTDIPLLNVTKDDEWEFIWDQYGQEMQPLTSHIPLMTTVGNHESFYNWTAFSHRYFMPGETSGGHGNFWFSYDHMGVHFASVSTEHNYSVGSPQWKWLQKDLQKASASAQRARVPWIVVVAHRPMYCSDASEYSAHVSGAPFQSAVEPLLLAAKVDVMMTGHEHGYERIHPTQNGTVVSLPREQLCLTGDGIGSTTVHVYRNPQAPLGVMVGSAGGLQEDHWVFPRPPWSAFRVTATAEKPWAGYGYVMMSVEGASRLSFEFRPLEGGQAGAEGVRASDAFAIEK